MYIYTHKHHVIPKHMGGTDDPSNLVELTVEDHAIAHFVLYKMHGHWQDYIAWRGLSKRITCEQVIREVSSRVHTGREFSDEQKKNMSLAKRGKKNPMYGTVSPNAGKFGEEHPRWGTKHSEETKRKLSEAAKKRKRVDCPHCGKQEILPGHFGRYHKNAKCIIGE